MSRYIGISLNDDFTELCVGEEGRQKSFPTIVCKKKNSDTWLVGEAAYKATLDGSGVLVDKLLSLLRKKGTATIEKVCYSGEELMEQYLRAILSDAWTKESLLIKQEEAAAASVSSEEGERAAEGRAGNAGSESAAASGRVTVSAASGEAEEPLDSSEKQNSRGIIEILPADFSENAEANGYRENAYKKNGAATGKLEGENSTPDSSKGMLVLSLRKPEEEIFRKLSEILNKLKEEGDEVRLISHTESFVHYMLHQDKNLYNRLVGMFELSNQCLYYYEMQVSRGSRRYVVAASEAQEEAFNLDIIKTPSGARIADRILSSLAERNLSRKSFSSVFLSGRGFESTEFAPNFMAFICKGRRGCIEPRIFAVGAMHYAKQCIEEEKEEYTILCDTRVSLDISVKVVQKERELRLPIIHAGDSWMNRGADYEMILDRQNFVDFQLTPMVGGKKATQLRMLLEGFPERENRTTRIRLSTGFKDADHLLLTVRDEGFGELFPKTEAMVTEEIDLRKLVEEV